MCTHNLMKGYSKCSTTLCNCRKLIGGLCGPSSFSVYVFFFFFPGSGPQQILCIINSWVDKMRAITMETFWSTAQKATAYIEPHEHLRPQHGSGNSLLHKRQITSTDLQKICPWCCAAFLMLMFGFLFFLILLSWGKYPKF